MIRPRRWGRIALSVAATAIIALPARWASGQRVVTHQGGPTAADTTVMLIDSMFAAANPKELHQAVTCELGRAMREIGDRPAGAVFDSAYARYSQADNVRLEHTLGVITEFVDRRRCEAYLNARWHVPAVVPDSR